MYFDENIDAAAGLVWNEDMHFGRMDLETEEWWGGKSAGLTLA
jgi:hypothetical protein